MDDWGEVNKPDRRRDTGGGKRRMGGGGGGAGRRRGDLEEGEEVGELSDAVGVGEEGLACLHRRHQPPARGSDCGQRHGSVSRVRTCCGVRGAVFGPQASAATCSKWGQS